jgi:ubiquinone/menaquinone biosynthesis C-methylase UbiE
VIEMAARTAHSAAWFRRRERYSHFARLVGGMIGGRVERRIERHLLERAWVGTKAKRLRRYLVGGYQNPVINVQSILVRHELIREIDGGAHEELMDEELRWAVETHRALRKRQRELPAEHGMDWAEIKRSGIWQAAYDEVVADRGHFAAAWTEALRAEPKGRLSVIEAACGSANDYRCFDSYGMAPLLDYTGFDLTKKNIANAHKLFPDADFRVGDAQEIEAADGSYDLAMAHDFLEHLSPSAFNRAIDELCRVSRRGVLISFFNMLDQPDHQIQPRRTYHFNVLSKDRIVERVARHCSEVRVVHIRPMLAERFGFGDYFNGRAWTIIARH